MEMQQIQNFLVRKSQGVSTRFSEVLVSNGPLRIPKRREPTLLAQMARSVVGQQLSTAAAATIWARVGEQAAHQGLDIVEYVSTATEGLRAAGVSNAKCKALAGLCAWFESNPSFTERALGRLSHEERLKHLTCIWGIGPWTVDMASIFYFRDPDIWPTSDGAICAGVERILGRHDLTREQMSSIGRKFAPYRTFAALHIWKALDERKLS